jgi:hypothetical protein
MNVYAYRGCSMFQWEIVTVMRMMRDILVGRYPFLSLPRSAARRRTALWIGPDPTSRSHGEVAEKTKGAPSMDERATAP